MCNVYLANNSLYYGSVFTISDIYFKSRLFIYPECTLAVVLLLINSLNSAGTPSNTYPICLYLCLKY